MGRFPHVNDKEYQHQIKISVSQPDRIDILTSISRIRRLVYFVFGVAEIRHPSCSSTALTKSSAQVFDSYDLPE
jgi:hypothetical protein